MFSQPVKNIGVHFAAGFLSQHDVHVTVVCAVAVGDTKLAVGFVGRTDVVVDVTDRRRLAVVIGLAHHKQDGNLDEMQISGVVEFAVGTLEFSGRGKFDKLVGDTDGNILGDLK